MTCMLQLALNYCSGYLVCLNLQLQTIFSLLLVVFYIMSLSELEDALVYAHFHSPYESTFTPTVIEKEIHFSITLHDTNLSC